MFASKDLRTRQTIIQHPPSKPSAHQLEASRILQSSKMRRSQMSTQIGCGRPSKCLADPSRHTDAIPLQWMSSAQVCTDFQMSLSLLLTVLRPLGAKKCTPEINTSEIIMDCQWHFPMDIQRHFPTCCHCSVVFPKGLSLCDFWCNILPRAAASDDVEAAVEVGHDGVLVARLYIYIYIYVYTHMYIYIYR